MSIVDNDDLGISYRKNPKAQKPIKTPVTIESFTIIGEEGSMIIGQAVVHVGGVAGYDVTFIGPMQAVKNTQPKPEAGPILVTFQDLEKKE